ncbi:unnamed protein product [Spirodela intermedia]|uniref:RRM domain-containing protein n=1 Tax=Spirodela intermedia TaxID=51605 RepID=A0A7I8L2F8_SPIIN|nr:unnamed protein product [Spirodela intermedia]
MAQHPQRQHHTGGGPFGDTTYTKIFVGGLAWETQRETMRRYFDQFGEIQEAVVIRDKTTGRSKGYGFVSFSSSSSAALMRPVPCQQISFFAQVTFKDAESAQRACQDPSPVIDGRRANCNLASLGASTHSRSRPPTPQHGSSRPLKKIANMDALRSSCSLEKFSPNALRVQALQSSLHNLSCPLNAHGSDLLPSTHALPSAFLSLRVETRDPMFPPLLLL